MRMPVRFKAKSALGDKWLVANTLPHRESYACEHLARQNFQVYCPMITRRIKHARRVHDAPRPLFPGYVFVKHHVQGQRWHSILGTRGIKSLVRSGERPSELCGSFIEALKARETDGVIRRPERQLEIGQQVAVQDGPLDGLVGQIVELREKDRAIVLLNLLDQQTRTQLSTGSLAPI
jgi:transcriptional antiterminator RfaH